MAPLLLEGFKTNRKRFLSGNQEKPLGFGAHHTLPL